MIKAIYQEIADSIRNKILNNAYPTNRMPSERSLAESYGVNRITLRKALNELHNEGLIVKVGPRGTFINKARAVQEPLSSLKIAYLLVERHTAELGPYHGTIMSSIQQELRKNKSQMLFHIIESFSEIQDYLTTGTILQGLNGIILAGGITPLILKKVINLSLPQVMIGQLAQADEEEKGVDQVTTDPAAYTSRGINYLLQKQCRRIAFIDSPAYQWSLQAQQTYMRLLEENGINYQEQLVQRCSQPDMREAYDLAGKIAELNVDGIFIRNDILARGLYDGLMNLGIKAGRDIGWVSVGHIGDSVEHLKLPRLVIDPKTLGMNSLKLLISRIQSPEKEIVKEIVPLKFENI